MEIKILCQSCGIPLENEEQRGTEKNGLKNLEYCKFCYEDGEFKNPGMTLEDMKTRVETLMNKLNLPKDSIDEALSVLSILKRWENN